MTYKDECGICGRVFPYSYLRQCSRCHKLFCIDCMVEDATTGGNRLLCLKCARRVVAPEKRDSYERLAKYLRFRAAFTDTVKLSFAKIDGIIGDNLPLEAYQSESWWENTANKRHAKAWLNVGWEVSEVNLKEAYVVFKRVKRATLKPSPANDEGEEVKKPFSPAPSKIFRKRKLSKTKIAKLNARIKNIERQKSQTKLKGKFKL
ncbi:MAG: hypothetical protein QXR00_03145 [Candidatus Bathyarchaeia archaeon]